ncbi:MAG TPA: L-histidine N(alpha)-methyltransferase [Solirubrobacteraceae bacterium]|nr:L-histidine N(alpha)-methyltransferase [Solirubrobacteraceae bacterium]
MEALTPPEPVLEGAICIESHLDGANERSLADDVLDGLTRPFKELPPKHFYDARGAELFDLICELPEYYPTRAERAILEQYAGEISALTGAAELVELGSGTASKTRVLLDALYGDGTLLRYVPVDVTESMVRECAAELTAEYPGLRVHGVIGDFERHLDQIPPAVGARIVAFLGGTIGNFPPGSRRRVLREIATLLGSDDYLLMGTDLIKDPAVLEAAYDDEQGVTAEFNRNVLRVLNRELGADFEPDDFEHVALFDREHEWIEMRLRARREHTTLVRDLDLPVHFDAGEEMRTEISAKFTAERIEGDLAAAGLEPVRTLTDADGLFALTLSRAVATTATAVTAAADLGARDAHLDAEH